MRGSGLHHRIGWPSAYQGKMPRRVGVDERARARGRRRRRAGRSDRTARVRAAETARRGAGSGSRGGFCLTSRAPGGRYTDALPTSVAIPMPPAPVRCPWAEGSAACRAYHDAEWGVPVHDDRVFFEFLMLEGAQAGLSWSTILNKRDGLSRGVRGLRPRPRRPLRRRSRRPAGGGPRHRPQSRQDRERRRQRDAPFSPCSASSAASTR